MSLKTFITERREIDLSAEDARRIAKLVIRLRFAIPENAYVKNDYLYEDVRYGSCGEYENKIRKLTDVDKAALLVLKELR